MSGDQKIRLNVVLEFLSKSVFISGVFFSVYLFDSNPNHLSVVSKTATFCDLRTVIMGALHPDVKTDVYKNYGFKVVSFGQSFVNDFTNSVDTADLKTLYCNDLSTVIITPPITPIKPKFKRHPKKKLSDIRHREYVDYKGLTPLNCIRYVICGKILSV